MRGGRGASRERREGLGWWQHTSGMHRDVPTQGLGAKDTRGERTRNMAPMFVTLDVSKLSGWLNADAYCQVKGRACDAGRGVNLEAGGRGAAASRAACTGKARLKAWGPGHARSAQRTCRTCS